MPVGDVTGGAVPHPGGELGRGLTVMRRAADVAEVAGDPPPYRTMCGPMPGESMSDLVQQHLVHLRLDRAVSRSFAEWCAVIDIWIAAELLGLI